MKRSPTNGAALLTIVLLACAFFAGVFLHPTQMLYSDGSDFYAYTSFVEQFKKDTLLEHHTLPLWNNYALATTSFIGDASTFPYYPPNIIYYLLPVDLGYGYFALFHILLAGVFTYLFMRTLRVTRFGAFVAAAAFMFSGKLMVSLYAGHTMFLQLAFLPLALLLAERGLQQATARYTVPLALLLTFMFFGFNPQLFFYASYAIMIYVALRALFIWKESGSGKALLPALSVAAAFILVILLGAIHLFPSIAAIPDAIERAPGTAYSYYTSFSLPPQNILTFILPDAFGNPFDHTVWGAPNYWELNAFLGVIPLLLAGLALVVMKKNRHVIIFGALALYSLLFALGGNIPLLAKLHFLLPIINQFRAPARMLFIYTFAVAVLAGFGASWLAQAAEKPGTLLRRVTAIGALFALAALLIVPVLETQRATVLELGSSQLEQRVAPADDYADRLPAYVDRLLENMLLASASLLVFFLALFLRAEKRINDRFFKATLAATVLIPLWIYGAAFIQFAPPSDVYPVTPAAEFFITHPGLYRVVVFGTQTLPVPVAHKHYIQIVDKTSQLINRRFLPYLESTIPVVTNVRVRELEMVDISNPQLLDMLNVRYIASRDAAREDSRFHMVAALDDGTYIYQNARVLPRAYIIHRYETLADDDAFLRITSPEFDPHSLAIVDRQVPPGGEGLLETANITYYSPNTIMVTTNASSPGLLVLSEVWSKDWKAYDNGKKLELYRVNYLFRGVYVEEGQRTITFRYKPLAFRVGMAISLFSFAAVLSYLFMDCRRRTIQARKG